MSGDEWVVLLGALGGAFVLTVLFILGSRYRKVGPNEALVISGGSRGFRIIRGGGIFVCLS